jgi:hypothetical protein
MSVESTEINNNDETNEVVEISIPNITPYYAAKVANVRLAAEGSERKVTPQMMYTYAKKNTIATIEDAKGKKFFVGADFKAWLDKYCSGVETGTRVDIEELAGHFL